MAFASRRSNTLKTTWLSHMGINSLSDSVQIAAFPAQIAEDSQKIFLLLLVKVHQTL
jgi:hypothetical protein